LFLVDPVDEILVQWIFEFRRQAPEVRGKGSGGYRDDRDLTAKGAELSSLMDSLQFAFDARVRQVRLSGRLTSSPACLVVRNRDMSRTGETHEPGQGRVTRQKRIMEINPDHEIVVKMGERLNRTRPIRCSMTTQHPLRIRTAAEGSELDDSPKFNQALLRVLGKAI